MFLVQILTLQTISINLTTKYLFFYGKLPWYLRLIHVILHTINVLVIINMFMFIIMFNPHNSWTLWLGDPGPLSRGHTIWLATTPVPSQSFGSFVDGEPSENNFKWYDISVCHSRQLYRIIFLLLDNNWARVPKNGNSLKVLG